MKVVPYAAADAPALLAGLDGAGLAAPMLRHPSFVRHYYLSSPACRLLLLRDDAGRITATLGSERVRIRVGRDVVDGAIISSTFSVVAGAFPLLMMHWMKGTDMGLAFPGNALLDTMFMRQKRWVAATGLRRYWLNWGCPVQAVDPVWKRCLKPLVRRLRRVDASRFEDRLRGIAPAGLAVREVPRFDEAMVARKAAFGFRLEPDAEHLNWRFDTSLDYVRHRIFRIEIAGSAAGYVVIAEWPHCAVVSQCDGDDAHTLACAVLLSLARVNRGVHRFRTVIMTSMHTGMRRLLSSHGFSAAPADSPMYLAAFGAHAIAAADRDNWLVNTDVGDVGTYLGMTYAPS